VLQQPEEGQIWTYLEDMRSLMAVPKLHGLLRAGEQHASLASF